MHDNMPGSNGVWVYCELSQGRIADVALELLGKAVEFARAMDVKLTALLLGHNVERLAREPIYYGADEVIVSDSPVLREYRTSPYAHTVAELCKKYHPSILLLGATPQGRDLAPRVMAKLETGLTADCLDLELDEDGILVQTKPSYGGNVMCKIVCPLRRPQMATVRPKVFPLPARDINRQGVVHKNRVNWEDDGTVRFLSKTRYEFDEPKIEEADVIVAGGRGLETKENFELLKELAALLKGCVGVTRPLVDLGWAPHSHQIGQSGKTVKPKLIITCGISGAVQFTVGMQTAGCIVAINKDPDAPIFDIAHYGIVGKVEEILPALLAALRTGKS